MKNKFKLLLIPSIATLTMPFVTTTSCSKKTEDVTQSIINEFKAIAKIPHSSDQFLYEVPFKSKVMKLSNYLVKRVEELSGIHAFQDKYGNITFDVPYNDESLKDAPLVAIQAHMDMVFSFDPKQYDPQHYPNPDETSIDVVEEKIKDEQGNVHRALHSKDYKTSIGADNGIGLAQALTLISRKDIKHGNLRFIFTNCEENAMQGAMMIMRGTNEGGVERPATMPEVMQGVQYVLNIDGELQGDITVASSGGVGSHYNKKVTLTTPTAGWNKFKIDLNGFNGGHSGNDINLHGGNALKIINEVLFNLSKDKNNIQIADYSTPGTTAYNKIATDASITIACDFTKQQIQDKYAAVKTKYESKEESDWHHYIDMPATINVSSDVQVDKCLSIADSNKLINLIDSLDYGVQTWTEPGAMKENKTSANVGPVSIETVNNKTTVKLSSYSRSDDNNKIESFYDSNKTAADTNQFDYVCDAKFPPWLPDANIKLLNLTKEAWTNAGFKSEPTVSKVHCGLEPTWWSYGMNEIWKTQDNACVSYGPTILHAHMPTEVVYLDTIQCCWDATSYILKNISKIA